jgi:hypothetical protein
LTPEAVQISTVFGDEGLFAAKACEIDGARATSRMASNAIHAVRSLVYRVVLIFVFYRTRSVETSEQTSVVLGRKRSCNPLYGK